MAKLITKKCFRPPFGGLKRTVLPVKNYFCESGLKATEPVALPPSDPL